jgi:hypothetical protein
MMRPFRGKLFFIWTLLILLSSCRKGTLDVNVSGIEADVRVERFDRALFEADPDSLVVLVERMYEQYGDFFDVFNQHRAGIGQALPVLPVHVHQ